MSKLMLLYVPVVHKGYLKFFKRHENCKMLYIIGKDFIEEFQTLHQDIRALSPETARELLSKKEIFGFEEVKILSKENIAELDGKEIITANDFLSRKVAEKYLKNSIVEYDSVFLRWDESNVLSQTSVNYDRISENEFDRKMMNEAELEGEKSSCWWRHVGAVIVKDGEIILKSHNMHLPDEHAPYMNGDPRDFIKAGTNPEYASAIHSEQFALSTAARKGISLEGTDMYITVFPCPACSKMVAYSGIKRVFFKSGHASLDGEKVLKAKGVELIFVK